MQELRATCGRAPARDGRPARWAIACVASLAAHAGALLALHAAGAFAVPCRAPSFSVALAGVPAFRWEANRALPAPAERRPRLIEERRTPEAPGVIVPLPPDSAAEERPPPPNVRRLAARDQRVEKETVSSDTGGLANVLRVPRDAGENGGPVDGGARDLAPPGGSDAPSGGTPPGSDVAAPPPGMPAIAAAPVGPPDAPEPQRAIEAGAPRGGDGDGGPLATGARAGPALGGGAPDGLGLEEGPETRLDARRFAPAAYWTQVRERVQDEWERRARLATRRVDPDENTYFYKRRSVVIGLALDATGRVREVGVVESSRLEFYDALALAVVREQQPYPYPPPAAIGSDGAAKIRIRFEWVPSVLRRALR